MVQQPSDVHFATVSLSTDVTLHYAERGERKGEAIVFLHAYTDSWFAFSRALHLLSPSYHAFAPDERGHGDSDKPECSTHTLGILRPPPTLGWIRPLEYPP